MKICAKLFCSILLILSLATIAVADSPASYKLNETYVAVRTDVFNQLVANDKLVDVLKDEIKYYKDYGATLDSLYKQKTEIMDQRITLRDEIVGKQDKIIGLQKDELDSYSKLINLKEKEIGSVRFENGILKVIAAGAIIYAATSD